MGLFDVSIKNKLKKDTIHKDFLEFMKKNILRQKDYEIDQDNHSIEFKKAHLQTLLKYNTKIEIDSSKHEKEITVNAELADTLILTILIILAILFTYGFGVIVVVVFTYFQKKKATHYLETLITNYKTIT